MKPSSSHGILISKRVSEDSYLLAKLLFERTLADEVAVEVVKELVGLLAAQVY